jgi:hypothetical protein
MNSGLRTDIFVVGTTNIYHVLKFHRHWIGSYRPKIRGVQEFFYLMKNGETMMKRTEGLLIGKRNYTVIFQTHDYDVR